MTENRLSYLLKRLEQEFWHVTPTAENDDVRSVALSSILNEAASIFEYLVAPNRDEKIWRKLDDGVLPKLPASVTFAWGGISREMVIIHKVENSEGKEQWCVEGWDANNASKHNGCLGSLGDAISLCGACYEAYLQISVQKNRQLSCPNVISGIFRSSQVQLSGGTMTLSRANVRFVDG